MYVYNASRIKSYHDPSKKRNTLHTSRAIWCEDDEKLLPWRSRQNCILTNRVRVLGVSSINILNPSFTFLQTYFAAPNVGWVSCSKWSGCPLGCPLVSCFDNVCVQVVWCCTFTSNLYSIRLQELSCPFFPLAAVTACVLLRVLVLLR